MKEKTKTEVPLAINSILETASKHLEDIDVRYKEINKKSIFAFALMGGGIVVQILNLIWGLGIAYFIIGFTGFLVGMLFEFKNSSARSRLIGEMEGAFVIVDSIMKDVKEKLEVKPELKPKKDED